MENGSRQIDAYIDKAPEYARPILQRIRSLFHEACPEIAETMKWSLPHFEYQGIVGSMAAFKNYVSYGFFKGSLMKDPHKLFTTVGKTTMSAMKVASLAELPSDTILLGYIREAVELNRQGVKAPAPKKKAQTKLEVPADFLAALKKNREALAVFEAFSPSHKREYIEWIVEAKQEATRAKRIASALEMISEGKPKNWKYMKK